MLDYTIGLNPEASENMSKYYSITFREVKGILCFKVIWIFTFLQREEVTDWRKNVDAMSGMEGRKKLFAGPTS